MEASTLLLFSYLFITNCIGLFVMGSDKFSARSQTGKEKRIPEGLLFFLAILGGSVGVYAGMFLFRHKTQKLYFILGIPILIIQQLLFLQNYWPWLLNI